LYEGSVYYAYNNDWGNAYYMYNMHWGFIIIGLHIITTGGAIILASGNYTLYRSKAFSRDRLTWLVMIGRISGLEMTGYLTGHRLQQLALATTYKQWCSWVPATTVSLRRSQGRRQTSNWRPQP